MIVTLHYVRQDPAVSSLAVCGLDIDDDRNQPFAWTRSPAGMDLTGWGAWSGINCQGCLDGMNLVERSTVERPSWTHTETVGT